MVPNTLRHRSTIVPCLPGKGKQGVLAPNWPLPAAECRQLFLAEHARTGQDMPPMPGTTSMISWAAHQ